MNELVVESGKGTGTGTGTGSNTGTKVGAKRGPKPKIKAEGIQGEEGQTKFFVDLSSEEEERQLIFEWLKKANDKSYGRKIIFKDLVLFLITKLADKDIPKIQESSLSKHEKLQRIVDEHNQKHNTRLSLEDYFLMKAGIN